MSAWDPGHAAAFFDGYGEKEWTRFERRTGSSSLATHLHYLRRFVRAGDRVLDAGAGPGRFTLELLRLGADVTALDISPGQLELLRERAPDVDAQIGDITDLSVFPGDAFDATVCFGGPLSYVLDRAEDAVAELARVTRPGGRLLVSAMATIGATLTVAGGVAALVEAYGEETVRHVMQTGLLSSSLSNGHLDMRMYRARELQALLEPHGTVVAASATGIFLADNPAPADLLAELELDLGAEPGALDLGNHILLVLAVGT